MSMGHLYAIEFSGGLVKVGRAMNPKRRLAQHRSRVGVAGLAVLRHDSARCQSDAATAEQRLIARCAKECGQRRADEWFVGLDFARVCEWMTEEAERTPVEQAEPAGLMVRRDCYPFPPSGGYICRACCRLHVGESAFLCPVCVDRGYSFDGRLKLRGSNVPLWSGIEPGTEVRPFDGVSCEDLRPDTPWFRVPDGNWRYGRPLIDYSVKLPELIDRKGAPDVPHQEEVA